MRLFVAAYPSPEAGAHLREIVSSLAMARPVRGRSPRLSPQEQWHVTLAFLGDVPGGGEAAVRAVEAVATTSPPFRLRLSGSGRFGRGRYTVVWAGLRGDLVGLGALADCVRRELKREHLPFDPRPFRPHLTLARPGDRMPADSLAADLERLATYEGPLWTVDRIHLVRSVLGSPPRYESVAVRELGGSG